MRMEKKSRPTGKGGNLTPNGVLKEEAVNGRRKNEY